MATEDVREIIKFLEEKGLHLAASALREEVSERSDGFGLLGLRPLKIEKYDDDRLWRPGSESSSSTGAFISMTSSPSGPKMHSQKE